jgi:hypothetical protein
MWDLGTEVFASPITVHATIINDPMLQHEALDFRVGFQNRSLGSQLKKCNENIS